MMEESSAQSRNWDREYLRRGIPSSFRDEPSGAVSEFAIYLKRQRVEEGRALDIGCGTGRNAVFLARQGFAVSGIDISKYAISIFKKRIKEASLGNADARVGDVTQHWPFASSSFDIAIDTFCYKHQTTENGKGTYRRELARVLKPGGLYLLTLAGPDDGYYGPLLRRSGKRKANIVLDPANRVKSILYSREALLKEFRKGFLLLSYKHRKGSRMMHGRSYPQSTHQFILKRRQATVGSLRRYRILKAKSHTNII